MRSYPTAIFLLILLRTCFAEDTMLALYRPFGEASEQQAPIIVGEQYDGYCFQQSAHIKREDAWRCSIANKIYDPCFIKPYGNHREAVCPQSPWVGQSVLIHLTMPVDDSGHQTLDFSTAYPWAVELHNGEKCQAIDPGQFFDNLPIRYQCDSHHVLFGHLQRCKAEWSMLQRSEKGDVETVTLVKAWF